jgi:Right handed beta helix region
MPAMVSAATYYASPAGSGNTCSLSSPCSLDIGTSKLRAGDTLYLRGGSYYQTMNVGYDYSGTSSAPITVAGYPGETAIIDGQDKIPSSSCWSFLVNIWGSYVIIKDMKVINSYGAGVSVSGSHSSIINVTVDRAGETGVVLGGDYDLADGVTVHKNGQRYPVNCSSWGSALCSAGQNNVIQNSLVYENVGEGLNSYANAHGTVIQDSISYDNGLGIYLDSTGDCIVQRNLVYFSPGKASNGIVIGHEQPDNNTIINITMVNNLVLGAFVSFQTDSNVPSLVNIIIAHNTFVNTNKTQSQIDSGYNMNVYFRPDTASFTNCFFENNIVLEEDARQKPIYIMASHPGLTFSNNLWSKTPMAGASGSGDVIGDPKLAKAGLKGAGQLTADWFKLLADSPAIDKAKILSQVADDYFKNARGTLPDIGAIEYAGGTTPPACVAADINCDSTVDVADLILVSQDFGKTVGYNTKCDTNTDKIIDIFDVVYVASRFT